MTTTQWFVQSRQVVLCLLVSAASFLAAQAVVSWSGQSGVAASGPRSGDLRFASGLAVAPWLALLMGPLAASLWGRHRWREEARELARLVAELRQQVSDCEEIQRSLQSLLEFRERERSLVSNEIHDGFVQEAVGAQMFLESLVARLPDKDASSTQQLNQALGLLRRSIEEGRQLVNDLKSLAVDQLGFLPAVQRLAHDEQDRFGLSVLFRYQPGFPELHVNTQRTLYRIIQEALSNIRRHSDIREAAISLQYDQQWIILEVKDLGRGFDPAQVDNQGFGLRGIRERAGLLHGSASIASSPGAGTTILVRVPREPSIARPEIAKPARRPTGQRVARSRSRRP